MARKKPNSKYNVISFRIDDQEKALLQSMAEEQGDSISNLLRRKLNMETTRRAPSPLQ